ncbi:F-box domain containing protein [Trema orientale]|uniref:F-box domain containing protein n=1 Tax=Trema orientale TaxID=63057 RepID=A0A2P5ER42_TREOI|nr:F-box domain containing protein [Trema orientale]
MGAITSDPPPSLPCVPPRRSKRIKLMMWKKLRDSESIDDKGPVASSAISSFSDDLLLEMFLRLPDRPSLARCSIVCKRWFSLISSTQFILSFNQFRGNRKPFSSITPFDIFFNYDQYYPNFHKLTCSKQVRDKSKHITGITTSNLDFLPYTNMVVRASFDGFLLVSHQGCYYICNPFTRQWLALPEIPSPIASPLDPGAYGFLCEPSEQVAGESTTIIMDRNNKDISQYRYRVLLIYKCEFYRDGRVDFRAAIFCSETGNWLNTWTPLLLGAKFKRFEPLPPDVYVSELQDIVACKGVLYCLRAYTKIKGIIAYEPFAFDPFGYEKRMMIWTKCHFIPMPLGFSCKRRPPRSKGRELLGVVQGQLRLLQLQEIKREAYFDLKVWELIDYAEDTRSWLLVHEVKLKGADEIFELAFHSNNGNMIFMVCDHKIYLYDIEKEEYEKICEFPYKVHSLFTIKGLEIAGLPKYT